MTAEERATSKEDLKFRAEVLIDSLDDYGILELEKILIEQSYQRFLRDIFKDVPYIPMRPIRLFKSKLP